jgi:hypothetical protein
VKVHTTSVTSYFLAANRMKMTSYLPKSRTWHLLSSFLTVTLEYCCRIKFLNVRRAFGRV